MAVKPATTFTLATNAAYSVGPFIGSATKVVPGDIPNGFVPGTGIVSEYNNYMFHWSGQWITNWLNLGSSAAGLDAHIIETDVNGQTNIASANLGGTAATLISLVVSENSGAVSSAITSTNSSGGFALLGSGNGAGAAIRGLNSGAGAGVEGINVGGTGPGGDFQGAGGGHGLEASGGAGAGYGILATGGAAGGFGIEATGTTTFSGVRGVGGPTNGSGVFGVPTSDTAYGVLGHTTATASSVAFAVAGIAQGTDGVGVFASSSLGDGYALIAQADTGSPVKSPFRMVPQNDDPSSGAEGDMTYNSTTDELRGYVNSRWQTAWTTQNGFTRGLVGPSSGSNNNSAAYTTLSTCVLPAPYEPKHTGSVVIMAAAEFGSVGGTLHTIIDVRLYDATAAAVIWQQNIENPNATGSAYDRPWSIVIPYGLPGTGSRTIELQFRRTGAGGTGVQARDAGVFTLGVF